MFQNSSVRDLKKDVKRQTWNKHRQIQRQLNCCEDRYESTGQVQRTKSGQHCKVDNWNRRRPTERWWME